MVTRIGSKNPVMHQRVPFKRIGEFSKWPMHEVPVKRPLEKRGEENGDRDARREPKNDMHFLLVYHCQRSQPWHGFRGTQAGFSAKNRAAFRMKLPPQKF